MKSWKPSFYGTSKWYTLKEAAPKNAARVLVCRIDPLTDIHSYGLGVYEDGKYYVMGYLLEPPPDYWCQIRSPDRDRSVLVAAGTNQIKHDFPRI